jgi:integrase
MPDRKYLTMEEIRSLHFSDFGYTDNLLIQLGLALGLRASEIVNIKTRHIDGDSIKIWDEKKDLYRVVVITDLDYQMILNYMRKAYRPLNGVKVRDRKLFNFTTKTLNNKVKRWFAELNIRAPARWHTFRHTYIRLMLDNAGDRAIQFIMLQTGNTAETILKYYAVPNIEDRIKVANALFDLIAGDAA